MTEQPEAFNTWAIIELMGHRKIAGRVSEQTIGGASLLRVDVPEVVFADGTIPAFTQFYGASGIYCLTPTTEDIARRFAAYCRQTPVAQYELPKLLAPPTQLSMQAESIEDEDQP